MRSKAFHLLVASGVLLAFLRGCCGTTDSYQCRYDIHVNKGQIIKAKESVNNGAVFLKHESVNDARLCYRLCCELDNCDLAQMQYKNSSDGYGRIEKICFMFHCGKPSKCSFGEHDHYATISYDRPEEKSKEVKTHNTPTKKVTKPKWNDDKAKTKKVKTKPSVSQECPEGVPVAMCYSDPCLRASCPSNREAICVPSYCGTCHYFFMDSSGTKVDCSGYDEETDLESKPDQSAQPKYKNEPENHDEDKQTSWEEEMEEQNTKYPEETMEPEISKQPEGKKEESSYQEVYMTKKPEIPTKYNQVEPKTQAQEETHEEAEKPDPWESYFGDKDLEHKLEELAPSTQHPSKLPVKVVKTTTKPFHHWREFVDNNPNFPYTIPNIKKTTKRPTTKEPTEKPTTKKPTEKQTTEKLTEKLTPQPTTEAPPPKKTEKLKITDVVPAVEENKQEDATHNHPPILERPVPLKNVSDVVVIETHRLRIIENKAVLPLAIFLVLAILLLFVVALRLRIVKSKLKRRPFATDDADYLINGMYL